MRFKSRTRALVGGAAAGLLGLSGLATLAPSASATPTSVDRISGANRWETAAAAFNDICDADATTGVCAAPPANILIVNGTVPWDALAGASLATPILPVLQDSVPSAIEDVLTTGMGGAFDFDIVGGSAAVSNTVLGDLVGLGGSFGVRYSGANRIETAMAVADAAAAQGTAIVGGSLTWADSLTASPLAYDGTAPLYLVSDASVSDVIDQMIDNGTVNVVIVGGTAVVSQAVEDALAVYFNVTRVSGANRYETSCTLNTLAVSANDQFGLGAVDVFGNTSNPTVLAGGDSFIDPLTGGAYAGEMGGVLQLTNPNSLSSCAGTFLTNNDGAVKIFGGTAAVAQDVEDSVDGLAPTTSGTVFDGDPDAFMFDGDDGTTFDNGGPGFDTEDDFTSWSVDGTAVTSGVFRSNISVGDTVTVTGNAVALTNNAVPMSGLVGQVDDTLGLFSIITPANNALVPGIDVAADADASPAATFTVDGVASDAAGFMNNASVGDSVVLTDPDGDDLFESFALTNGSTSGAVVIVLAGDPPTFTIGGLGDNPNSAEDSVHQIQGVDQTFTVDGVPTNADGFETALENAGSESDTATYSRANGLEAFALTDGDADAAPALDGSFSALAAVQADTVAADAVTPNGGTLDLFGGGDHFSIDFGDVGPGGTMDLNDSDATADNFNVVVDGVISTFAEAETVLAASEDIAPFGHSVVFDDGDGQNTLTITTVTNSPTLKVVDSDGVAASNGTVDVSVNGTDVATALDVTVDYSTAAVANVTYEVNHVAVTEADFLLYIDELDGANDFLHVKVTPGVGTAYHLTTDDQLP